MRVGHHFWNWDRAWDCLLKPYDLPQFLQKVRSILRL